MPALVQPEFLPMSSAEVRGLGWQQLDVLLITGDAYIDHPSFGVALLGRQLVAHGFTVGIVAQPRWDVLDDITALGRPALFAAATAGALDSMLAHYTAFHKKRSDDAYTPGGRAGARPNRATLVYANLLRRAFSDLPVILGGIEASLRRATHYDFWTDKLRRSVLLDSKADLLLYGMAEQGLIETARRLRAGQDLQGVAGSVRVGEVPADAPVITLPSHEAIEVDPFRLIEATLAMEQQVHQGGRWAVQQSGKRQVVFAPPPPSLEEPALDALYALPYSRRAHPRYTRPVPAADMIRWSITSHRGCGGSCTFCSLSLHQGRRIRSRSAASIRAEAEAMIADPDFKGSITDVGGPSANMWGAFCKGDPDRCVMPSCLHPKICASFVSRSPEQIALLRELSQLPGIKNVRVASGIRHDLALRDGASYIEALAAEYCGGQLKLAPEHSSAPVLELMRKPRFAIFTRFVDRFAQASTAAGKKQFIVPYLLSAFPGCTDAQMKALARWLQKRNWRPQQVQCFIPTPGTLATAMYVAEQDPTGQPIAVAKSDAARLRQHRILTGTGSPPKLRGIKG